MRRRFSEGIKSMVPALIFLPVFNSRLFLRLFMSYLVILVIPIACISIIVYAKTIRTLEQEVTDSTSQIVSQGRDIIYIHLGELNKKAIQLSESRDVIGYLSSGRTSGPEDIMILKEIMNDVRLTRAYQDLAYQIGIFFPEDETFVTSTASYDIGFFYENIFSYTDMTFSQWFDSVQAVDRITIWPARETMNDYGMPIRTITYLQPLPDHRTAKKAMLIAFIELDKLWQFFGDDGVLHYARIINPDGVSYGSTSGSLDSRQFDYRNDLTGAGGHLSFHHKGERYIGIYSTSRIVPWKYLYVIPGTEIFNQISPIKNIFIGVILFTILAGLAASYYLSNKNYQPVKRIVDFIHTHLSSIPDDENPIQREEEYRIIQEAIDESFTENRHLEQTLQEKMPVLKNYFLSRLLKFNTFGTADIQKNLDMYGISFPHYFFTVSVLSSEGYGDQSLPGPGISAAIKQVERILSPCYQVYVLEAEQNSLAIIINKPEPAENHEDRRLNRCLEQVREAVSDTIPGMVSLGAGRRYIEISGIYKSFHEAKIAANYNHVKGLSAVTYYGNIQKYDNTIYYPLEEENRLMHFARTGNYPDIEKILDEIFRINCRDRDLPPRMLKLFLNDLATTVWKVMDAVHLDRGEVTDKWMSSREEEDRTAEDVLEEVKDLYRRICAVVSEKEQSSNIYLLREIKKYIQKDFGNKNLCLNTIADHFHISPVYLSKFFKEQSGTKFIDYLNTFRLEKGKELMEKPGLPIHEISDQVGYLSSNTFIRVFKKYYGITPGEYRKSLAYTEE
ncbi:MAG: helix-turn-helix domain-containing protein [Spirochaetia bacterium]